MGNGIKIYGLKWIRAQALTVSVSNWIWQGTADKSYELCSCEFIKLILTIFAQITRFTKPHIQNAELEHGKTADKHDIYLKCRKCHG